MVTSCGNFVNEYQNGNIPILACENDITYPSVTVFLLYAIVIPILSEFGIFANFINALVFMRPRMTPSAFTYLSALSWIDCLSCILITLTSYSRSLFVKKLFWIRLDFQYLIPLFSISTGSANLILGFLTLDRWIYLKNGLPQNPPKFCTPSKARRNIIIIILFSIIINVPYFFIFNITDNGSLEISWFYYSTYYMVHNWITFTMLGVIPGIFLLIGNTALIVISRRIANHSKNCRANTITGKCARKRYINQTKLITTVIALVTLYLIGELPAHFTSRKSVVNLLFGGDITRINIKTWQAYEVGFTLLNALQLSFNIVIYAIINPAFMTEFFECLRNISDWILKVLFLAALSNCCTSMGSNIHNVLCKTRKTSTIFNNNNLNVSTNTNLSTMDIVENCNNNNNNNNTNNNSSYNTNNNSSNNNSNANANTGMTPRNVLTTDTIVDGITNNISFIALQIRQTLDNYCAKSELNYDFRFLSHHDFFCFNENSYDCFDCTSDNNKMRRHSLC